MIDASAKRRLDETSKDLSCTAPQARLRRAESIAHTNPRKPCTSFPSFDYQAGSGDPKLLLQRLVKAARFVTQLSRAGQARGRGVPGTVCIGCEKLGLVSGRRLRHAYGVRQGCCGRPAGPVRRIAPARRSEPPGSSSACLSSSTTKCLVFAAQSSACPCAAIIYWIGDLTCMRRAHL